MTSHQIYKPTDAGKKFSKSPVPSRRNDIMDYLYVNKKGTLEEISAGVGKPEQVARSELRKLKSEGLVKVYPDMV